MRLLQLARCSAKANSVATIIYPGSGYEGFLEEPEGIGATEWFTQHGIVGIMLEYRLPKSDVYRPLYEAQPTSRIVCLAHGWECDPNELGRDHGLLLSDQYSISHSKKAGRTHGV